jgi:hypothetical protein
MTARPILIRTQRETVTDRLRDIHGQSDALAREHVNEACNALMRAAELFAEIVADDIKAAFPPGVVDLARRLADDCPAKALTVRAIMERRG